MLFTRCPDCETTFRITAEALRKADGQVRCGRCACVFNGYSELRRRTRRQAGAPAEASPAPARERVHGTAPRAPVVAGAPAAGLGNAEHARGGDANTAALASASTLREETTAAADGLAVSESVAGARPAPPAPDPTADGANATTGAEAGLRSAERRPSRRRKNVRKPGRASPAAPGIATNDEKDPVVGEFSFAGVVAELEA